MKGSLAYSATESREYDADALFTVNLALARGRRYADELSLELSPSSAAVIGDNSRAYTDMVEWLRADFTNRAQLLIGMASAIASRCVYNPECVLESGEVLGSIAITAFQAEMEALTQSFTAPVDASDELLALARRAIECKRRPTEDGLLSLARDLSQFTD